MAKKKNPAAVAMSRLAAKARMAKITPEQRSEIARNAARARWGKARAKGRGAREGESGGEVILKVDCADEPEWTGLYNLFPKTGPPGIEHRMDVDEGGWAPEAVYESLLFYGPTGNFEGIFLYYPLKKPPEFFVIVHPECRRCGIGTQLLGEAVKRWSIDFGHSCYTTGGAEFVKHFLIGQRRWRSSRDRIEKLSVSRTGKARAKAKKGA
jgi:GNAT superfamily N-acetyltransferase